MYPCNVLYMYTFYICNVLNTLYMCTYMCTCTCASKARAGYTVVCLANQKWFFAQVTRETCVVPGTTGTGSKICTIGSLTCRIPVHLCLPHWSSQPENWPLTCSRKDFGHMQRAEQSVKHRLGRRCGGVIDVLSMRVFCQTTLITNVRNFKRVQIKFKKGTSLEKKGYTLSPEYRVGQNQKYGNINWGRVSWCQVQEA